MMETQKLAKISKALSDPTRLRIYEMIAAKGEVICGDLVENKCISAGTVSHHLKVLSEAELIDSRREGQFIYNRALPATMVEYTNALTKLSKTAALSVRKT
jgi:ArsR family transcriptional regulator, arsenate/arsenite/antimonite-responsive transcriptional repressor